jgi:GTPase SAR1 family protein
MQVKNQSANQVWKRLKKTGQTTLDFVPWLEREKKKGFKNFEGEVFVPVNTYLNQAVQQAISTDDKPSADTKKYILGAPKAVWIGIGAALAIVVGVIVYKKIKG